MSLTKTENTETGKKWIELGTAWPSGHLGTDTQPSMGMSRQFKSETRNAWDWLTEGKPLTKAGTGHGHNLMLPSIKEWTEGNEPAEETKGREPENWRKYNISWWSQANNWLWLKKEEEVTRAEH